MQTHSDLWSYDRQTFGRKDRQPGQVNQASNGSGRKFLSNLNPFARSRNSNNAPVSPPVTTSSQSPIEFASVTGSSHPSLSHRDPSKSQVHHNSHQDARTEAGHLAPASSSPVLSHLGTGTEAKHALQYHPSKDSLVTGRTNSETGYHAPPSPISSIQFASVPSQSSLSHRGSSGSKSQHNTDNSHARTGPASSLSVLSHGDPHPASGTEAKQHMTGPSQHHQSKDSPATGSTNSRMGYHHRTDSETGYHAASSGSPSSSSGSLSQSGTEAGHGVSYMTQPLPLIERRWLNRLKTLFKPAPGSIQQSSITPSEIAQSSGSSIPALAGQAGSLGPSDTTDNQDHDAHLWGEADWPSGSSGHIRGSGRSNFIMSRATARSSRHPSALANSSQGSGAEGSLGDF